MNNIISYIFSSTFVYPRVKKRIKLKQRNKNKIYLFDNTHSDIDEILESTFVVPTEAAVGRLESCFQNNSNLK